jgi:hypothetical protein
MVTRIRRRRRRREPEWASWPDDALLDLRFRDLGVRVEGTWLAHMVAKLHDEIAARGLRFRPHCWLSSEWFSPDGVPGIAIPFYLAHPRLMRLEYRQMLEVEGGTRAACMRILRHEAGHAIDTAFRIRRKRSWQEVFGPAARPYPDTYRPEAGRRDHVLHLDWWYAQSHPLEDFAETFAVWLTPRSAWRKDYAGWPALRKLEYVDALMSDLALKRPAVRSRERVEPVSALLPKLRSHYRAKRGRYGVDLFDRNDGDLLQIFSGRGRREAAASFLRRARPDLRDLVARRTGQHAYAVDQFLRYMTARCRALGLRLGKSERETRLEVAVLVTIQVADHLYRGGRPVEL